MKKLSRQQEKEKAEHESAVRAAQDELEQAIGEYNSKMEEAKQPVEAAQAKLNEAIVEADSWRESIHSDQQDYFDARNDKWQEGDAGTAYADWMDIWNGAFEEVELDFPDELGVPDMEVADSIDQLPDNPD